MADSKKPLLDLIAALLDFAADVEQTPEEAEQELRERGVDVDGFLARVRARRAKQADEERTDELHAEVHRLRAERAKAIADATQDAWEQLASANALLGRLEVWSDTYGQALAPHGGSADTYGDGVRACKAQVKAILAELARRGIKP